MEAMEGVKVEVDWKVEVDLKVEAAVVVERETVAVVEEVEKEAKVVGEAGGLKATAGNLHQKVGVETQYGCY